jgi:hypothetical protein
MVRMRPISLRPLEPVRPRLAAAAVSWFAISWAAVAAAIPPPTPADAETAALIEQLGADDFAVRESAAARLAAAGAAASDALLAAAESSDDLEVALKARWLVESLPLTTSADPPEVAALLERFARSEYDVRVQIMHRLLRLDDDAGIEPLARIVRLERTTTGSRIAAALLVREWAADDPAWPALAARIAAGLGPSSRPAAGFLRGLVDASCATSPSARDAGIDAATAALALLGRPGAGEPRAGGVADDPADASLGAAKTMKIFRRCMAELLAAAGRRPEALAQAEALFTACRGGGADEELTAAEVAWLADHGLPEAAALLAERSAAAKQDLEPLVAYAVAVARRRSGDAAATALADLAHQRLSGPDVDLARSLQAAMLLARWGAADWALRAYGTVTGNPQAPSGEFALAGILCAEFLHDQQRDADAAELLRRVVEGRTADDGMDQILMRLERDPRSVRSRMLYFAACAAAARGDAAGQRRLLEESLRSYGKDVDSLIALYHSSAADERADATARVRRALEQIEEEIQAVPDDPNGYNEYAWLVSNTEGDVPKATRYAKRALEHSFDSSSYLDTLAHCRAAGGDLHGAVRTQALAVRQEPHNLTIRRNYARFLEAEKGR